MEVNLSKKDIDDIAKQVKTQIVGDFATGEFERIVNERVDKKVDSYLKMALEQDMIGQAFYKEIERLFDKKQVEIVRMAGEIIQGKLGNEALRQHLVNKLEQALDDCL